MVQLGTIINRIRITHGLPKRTGQSMWRRNATETY